MEEPASCTQMAILQINDEIYDLVIMSQAYYASHRCVLIAELLLKILNSSNFQNSLYKFTISHLIQQIDYLRYNVKILNMFKDSLFNNNVRRNRKLKQVWIIIYVYYSSVPITFYLNITKQITKQITHRIFCKTSIMSINKVKLIYLVVSYQHIVATKE